tara:strand:- start:397 stop:570 length:174 start_codon:yes stop_codon:yes gene_type:complete
MRILLILIFITLSGCIKDFDFNPASSLLQQLIKGKYDEKGVRSLASIEEKHPSNYMD